MKSFATAALLSLSALGSLAAPSPSWWHGNGQCLSAKDAQQVADNYAELIRNYTVELANASLDVNFVDYSESVNSLINTCPQGSAAVTLPLLSPTFSNRQQFETGQGQQAPINFNQLNLEYNCNTVTIRWETTNTAPIPNPRPVVGIILIEAVKAPAGNIYPWIVKTVYSEFDAAAWLQNLEQAGICSVIASSSPPLALPSGTVPPPSGTSPASTSATPSGAAPVSYSSPVYSTPASYSSTLVTSVVPSSYSSAPVAYSTTVVGSAVAPSYSSAPTDTCTDSSAAPTATYSA